MRLRATRLSAISNAIKMYFSPASLFKAGEQGAWYDPSDLTTLFQDSAGTTPVTAVEQPVGLMLDKSRGLVLGPELNTGNVIFIAASWTNAGGGVFNGSASSSYFALNATDGLAFVRGKICKITFTVSNYVSGTLRFGLDNNYSTYTTFSNGTYSVYLTVGSANADDILIWGSSFTGSVSNISVRELPGNHAFQTTSASRPVLSARVNLLTKTEQFDDAVWNKNNAGSWNAVTVSANQDSAPNETLTADKVTSPAIGAHGVAQQFTCSPSTTYTYSVYIKDIDYGSGLKLQSFSTLGSGPSETSITISGNWALYSVQITTGIAQTTLAVGVGNQASKASKSFLIWGADLRASNDGIGLPAYQRVNTATDYDTQGFPLYLRCDGVDDGMQTNSIDFTATDKMTVWAGVRKLSDAYGFIAELSANATANNGAFLLNSYSDAKFYFGSRGSTTYVEVGGGAVTAPRTAVLAGVSSVGAPPIVLRENGAQAGSNASSQGAGTYGNYPLFLFRRAGTSLPFNGRMYSLIVRGAASTTAQIEATEDWVETKTFGKDMNNIFVDQVLTADNDAVLTADGQDIFMRLTYQ